MIQTDKEMMTALLATEAGRLFCGQLMRETGVFAPMTSTDTNTAMMLEGQRCVGVHVFTAVVNAGGDPISIMKEYAVWFKQQQKQNEKQQQEEQSNG